MLIPDNNETTGLFMPVQVNNLEIVKHDKGANINLSQKKVKL
jgi:hypothetical protein